MKTKTMNIEEIKTSKEKAEKKMWMIVQSLQEDTGLEVAYINTRSDYKDGKSVTFGVSISLQIN